MMRSIGLYCILLASLAVSCNSNSDVSYSSFFGDDPLDEEMFEEETLVVDFHPTLEEGSDLDKDVPSNDSITQLQPVIDENKEPELAEQFQSFLEFQPTEVIPLEEALVEDLDTKGPLHVQGENSESIERKELN